MFAYIIRRILMKNLLLSFALLFILNACGNSKEEAAKQAKLTQALHEVQAQKEALLVKLKTKENTLLKLKKEVTFLHAKLLEKEKALTEALLREKSCQEEKAKCIAIQHNKNKKLSPVGIAIEKNRITIDTNKTKDFFQQISKNLEAKMEKLSQELEKGIVDEKEAGVHIDESHINIDFNKTKDFLETWGKQLQSLVNELNR